MRNKLYRLAIWYIGRCNAKWNRYNKYLNSSIKSVDRLTYRDDEKAYLFYGLDAEWSNFGRYEVLDNAIQRLAYYEDQEEIN